MKIVSSKDKNKVLRWAKKNNRGFLWLEKGVWHAATTTRHVPVGRQKEPTGVEGVELEFPRGNHTGRELAWLRESCGLTQAEIAKRMSK